MQAQARIALSTFGARLKIGLAFAALGAAAFGAMGLLSGMHARQQIEHHTGEALFELARNVTLNLDMGLFERYREIVNLAAVESRVDRRLDESAWFEVVETLQTSLPEYSWIGVTDDAGTVMAATDRLLEGQNVAKRPWYAEGRKRAYVGDLHEALLLSRLLPASASGEPYRFLDFSAPLVRNGRAVGVIGAHLSWTWAQERCEAALSTLNHAYGVEVALFDVQGKELLRPQVGSPAFALPVEQLDTMVRHRFGVRRWEDDRRYLTASVRSHGYAGYKGLGWTVVVRQPLDQAMASARSLERRIWLSGLAGALMFGVAGWLLAGRLTAPLRAVAARAREVAALTGISLDGHHERDEVRQLAASLTSLVAQLQAREAELCRINDELEARVNERTASLSRANADLESFSRSVSHDLKGPIAGMGAMLRQFLGSRQDALAERDREILGALAQECDRLQGLVEGMLSLAVVDRRPQENRAIDMPALVRAVVDELRSTHAARPEATAMRDDTEVVIGPMPTHVHGDPVLLRQVWSNLLSNAFKFTANVAHPRVEISGEERSGEVMYRVRDNGPGFEPAKAAMLFQAFQRLPEARAYPGTGVGLSIVQKVVQRHEGKVWCEARPGQGAQFCFSLPKTSAAAPGPAKDVAS